MSGTVGRSDNGLLRWERLLGSSLQAQARYWHRYATAAILKLVDEGKVSSPGFIGVGGSGAGGQLVFVIHRIKGDATGGTALQGLKCHTAEVETVVVLQRGGAASTSSSSSGTHSEPTDGMFDDLDLVPMSVPSPKRRSATQPLELRIQCCPDTAQLPLGATGSTVRDVYERHLFSVGVDIPKDAAEQLLRVFMWCTDSGADELEAIAAFIRESTDTTAHFIFHVRCLLHQSHLGIKNVLTTIRDLTGHCPFLKISQLPNW